MILTKLLAARTKDTVIDPGATDSNEFTPLIPKPGVEAKEVAKAAGVEAKLARATYVGQFPEVVQAYLGSSSGKSFKFPQKMDMPLFSKLLMLHLNSHPKAEIDKITPNGPDFTVTFKKGLFKKEGVDPFVYTISPPVEGRVMGETRQKVVGKYQCPNGSIFEGTLTFFVGRQTPIFAEGKQELENTVREGNFRVSDQGDLEQINGKRLQQNPVDKTGSLFQHGEWDHQRNGQFNGTHCTTNSDKSLTILKGTSRNGIPIEGERTQKNGTDTLLHEKGTFDESGKLITGNRWIKSPVPGGPDIVEEVKLEGSETVTYRLQQTLTDSARNVTLTGSIRYIEGTTTVKEGEFVPSHIVRHSPDSAVKEETGTFVKNDAAPTGFVIVDGTRNFSDGRIENGDFKPDTDTRLYLSKGMVHIPASQSFPAFRKEGTFDKEGNMIGEGTFIHPDCMIHGSFSVDNRGSVVTNPLVKYNQLSARFEGAFTLADIGDIMEQLTRERG